MNRTEYRNELESLLNTMENRIADLESRVAKANVSGKTTFQRMLDEVKVKRDSVRAELKQAGAATDSAWDEFKRGLDGAWTELETSYERARSKFTDASPLQ